MRKQHFRAVAAGVAGLLGIFGAVVSSPSQVRESALTIDEYRGMLGTDSTGRRNLCDHLQKLFPAASESRQQALISPKTKEDVRLACEGYHVKILVLVVTNWSSDFRTLRSEALLKEILGKPYTAVVDSLDGLVLLYGDKQPSSTREIKTKLENMRARTVGEFLYACGFEKLVVRDQATKAEYLGQSLSGIDAPLPR
jgi:hypothetical protein